MRKCSLTLLAALLAIVLGLGAVACGSGGETASGQTPQEAVTAALEGLQTAGSQSGTYEIAITVDADDSESDPMMQALLGQPITISGDFASQSDPVRADLTLGLNLMGFSVTAGVRGIDDSAWLNVMGEWYQVPTEELQASGDANVADIVDSIKQAMDEQGLDTNTWYNDLKVVGQETLVDTQVSHLSATLDIQKMLTDILVLAQNPAITALMGEADSLGSDTGVSLPDAAETEELQNTVEQMVQNATIDFWLAESDNSPRKIVLAMDVTIPEEMGATGIGGANIVVTVNLNAPGQTIEVTAPTSSKPLSELETDLQSNPLLSGLGGLMGGGLLGE